MPNRAPTEAERLALRRNSARQRSFVLDREVDPGINHPFRNWVQNMGSRMTFGAIPHTRYHPFAPLNERIGEMDEPARAGAYERLNSLPRQQQALARLTDPTAFAGRDFDEMAEFALGAKPQRVDTGESGSRWYDPDTGQLFPGADHIRGVPQGFTVNGRQFEAFPRPGERPVMNEAGEPVFNPDGTPVMENYNQAWEIELQGGGRVPGVLENLGPNQTLYRAEVDEETGETVPKVVLKTPGADDVLSSEPRTKGDLSDIAEWLDTREDTSGEVRSIDWGNVKPWTGVRGNVAGWLGHASQFPIIGKGFGYASEIWTGLSEEEQQRRKGVMKAVMLRMQKAIIQEPRITDNEREQANKAIGVLDAKSSAEQVMGSYYTLQGMLVGGMDRARKTLGKDRPQITLGDPDDPEAAALFQREISVWASEYGLPQYHDLRDDAQREIYMNMLRGFLAKRGVDRLSLGRWFDDDTYSGAPDGPNPAITVTPAPLTPGTP